MLNLTLYYQTKSLYQEFFSASSKTQIIVPGPDEADEIRKTQPNASVFTIAEFLRKLQDEIKPTRKSELYHLLGILCKKLRPELRISEFDEVFKWLTDIRNNVTDSSVLTEIYESFDNDISELLLYCSEFIEASEYNDEAKLYKFLLQSDLKKFDHDLVFLGFKHFSSIQLDFLRILGNTNNVSVTCPKIVFENSEHNDWVQWGNFDDTMTIDLPVEKLGNVIPLSRTRLANFLNTQKVFKELSYFSSDMNLGSLQSTGNYNSAVKFNVEFFKLELDWVEKVISLFVKDSVASPEFNKKIEGLIGYTTKSQEARKLKVLLELKRIYKKSQDLTETFDFIDKYKLKLMMNVLELNLPRISVVTRNNGLKLKKPRSGEFSLVEDSVGFLDTSFLEFGQAFDSMPVELKKKLAQLGVIKRSKMEESYHRFIIDNFLGYHERLLVYEDTEELRELFKDYQVFDATEVNQRFSGEDYLVSEKKVVQSPYFSASRLQTYIDCPRRFYFQYQTDKLKKNTLIDEVTAFEKGNWEHLLIAKYFEGSKESDKLETYVEQELESVLSDKNLVQGDKELIKYESGQRIINGIQFVQSLIKEFPGIGLTFEKNIKSDNFRGSVDLHVEKEGFSGVIDFKRSKGSIPSFTEVKTFNSIQVLTYLNKVPSQEKFLGGYFCLETPEDSLFFGTETLLKKYKFRPLEFETIHNYSEFEKQLITKINEDVRFLPEPRKSLFCNYCELRNLCPRQ